MNLELLLKSLPETTNNVVSVLSGGLDSTIMTYALVEKYGADNVIALSYQYNQKQVYELECASKTCEHLGIKHEVMNLSILGEIAKSVSANIAGSDIVMPTIRDVLGDPQPTTYVPFRNMILSSIALSFAEANNANFIFTGLQSTDEYGYWDTTQRFVDSINAVAEQNRTFKCKFVAPFVGLSKTDEIAIAQQIGNVAYEHTLTCYNPNDKHESCGTCPSCAERIKAFMNNGMYDPIQYQFDNIFPCAR